MYTTAQRSQDNPNLGFNSTPDDIFRAAGFQNTGSFDISGQRMETPPASPNNDPSVLNNNTDTPPTPTSEALAMDTPSFDISAKFGGKFKSVDELESYLTEVEQKASKDPFANDLVRNLNKAIAEGIDPDVYMYATSLDIDQMSDKEALILRLQFQNKELSREDAEFIVSRDYRLSDDEGEPDMSDPDVREAQIRLKIEAPKAKDFLNDYKAQSLESPVERRMAELTEAWTPEIPKVVDEMKTFTVNSKAGTFSIPASEEAIKSAQSLLTEVINSGLLDTMPDKEGREVAKAIVEKEILKHDFQRMVDHIAEKLEQNMLMKQHNVRQPNPNTGIPQASQQENLVSWLKSVRQ